MIDVVSYGQKERENLVAKVKCENCGKETYMGTFGPYCHIYCYLDKNKK